jgi:polyphenol oxidase
VGARPPATARSSIAGFIASMTAIGNAVRKALARPRGVTGAAHAGRPGLAAGVVPATVAAMCELGADPVRIVARTGPTVCGRCYEVPAALRDEVERAVPGTATTTAWGTPAIDIPAGVRAQLRGCGVRDIALSRVCTLQSPDHFSYGRDGRTGRLASYVRLADG